MLFAIGSVVVGLFGFAVIMAFVSADEKKVTEKRMLGNGFKVSKSYNYLGKTDFYLDDTTDTIAFRYGLDVTFFRMEDILDFGILDDTSIERGGRFWQATTGIALAGIPGGIIGAAGARKNTSMCERLGIVLTLRNDHGSTFTFDLISSKTPRNGLLFRESDKFVRNVIASLTYLKDKTRKEDNV